MPCLHVVARPLALSFGLVWDAQDILLYQKGVLAWAVPDPVLLFHTDQIGPSPLPPVLFHTDRSEKSPPVSLPSHNDDRNGHSLLVPVLFHNDLSDEQIC